MNLILSLLFVLDVFPNGRFPHGQAVAMFWSEGYPWIVPRYVDQFQFSWEFVNFQGERSLQ